MAALQSNLYLVIVAMGKPKANTILSAVLLLISLPAIIYASLQYGVLGAAYAHFFASLLGFSGIVIVFSRITGMPKRKLFAVMWRPLLASSAMAFILFSATASINATWPMLPQIVKLVTLISIGVLIYMLSILASWYVAGKPNSAEKMLLNFLYAKALWLQRFRPNDH